MTFSGLFLYTFVISVYSPGVLTLIIYRRVWNFPILCFAFVGMFIFNAVGSVAVFSNTKLYWLNFDTGPVSLELALVLVAQAIAFYFVCGTYVLLRPISRLNPTPASNDRIFIVLSVGAIVCISAFYYRQTGGFLIQAALDGSMDIDNAFAYRQKFVYGIPHWPIYNLAFVFIPILLSNHGLLLFLGSGRRAILMPGFCYLISFAASLSLGSKGGLLGFLLSLSVTYASFLGMLGGTPFVICRSRKFQLFSAFALMTLVGGYTLSATETLTAGGLIQRILYRTFVAYPETLAAAISYFQTEGPLGISVFPTMRGLLPHEQVNLSALIHQYQANIEGGVSVPFAGEAYLVAGWRSLLLLLPIVFASLIFIQEVAGRLRLGLFGIALSAIYAHLAIQLSLNGMFGSLYNFMYPTTVLALGGGAFVISFLFENSKSL